MLTLVAAVLVYDLAYDPFPDLIEGLEACDALSFAFPLALSLNAMSDTRVEKDMTYRLSSENKRLYELFLAEAMVQAMLRRIWIIEDFVAGLSIEQLFGRPRRVGCDILGQNQRDSTDVFCSDHASADGGEQNSALVIMHADAADFSQS